jgi:hypothetical protein
MKQKTEKLTSKFNTVTTPSTKHQLPRQSNFKRMINTNFWTSFEYYQHTSRTISTLCIYALCLNVSIT